MNPTDYRRIILFALLLMIGLNLYQAWQREYPMTTTATPMVSGLPERGDGVTATTMPPSLGHASPPSTNPHPQTAEPTPSRLVTLQNDVLSLSIDLNQGEVVGAALKHYAQDDNDPNPFTLLNNGEQRYVATSHVAAERSDGTAIALPQHYAVKPEVPATSTTTHGSDVLLVAEDPALGITIEKRLSLSPGSYLVKVTQTVTNHGTANYRVRPFYQLSRRYPKTQGSSMFHTNAYVGAAISNPGHKLYQKVPFKQIKRQDLQQTVDGGWIAMQQHYFLSAWVPPPQQQNVFYSRYQEGDRYLIGSVGPGNALSPNQSLHFSGKLYLGPEITAVLKKVAPGLNLTVDYGILSVISLFIFSVMSLIHSVVGNWGWSIVLVTLMIKLAFYHLSAKSYRSMASMRRIQPKLAAIKAQYGDDKTKLSQETMQLYRKENINPLGGCLPILIQIPVFISLYWVLLESVELRQAPWIGWITDLSEPDPYYILPVIMGISMFAQQRMSPAAVDPAQARMMMLLPVFFTFLFSHFPSGLVLYWTVNNTLSILQQWVITRRHGDQAKPNASSHRKKKELKPVANLS